jgi:putative glutamine amidotransferase
VVPGRRRDSGARPQCTFSLPIFPRQRKHAPVTGLSSVPSRKKRASFCKVGADSSIIYIQMTIVAITSADLDRARRYVEAIEAWQAQVKVITPQQSGTADELMREVGGLLLPGGPDIHPSRYGAATPADSILDLCPPLDDLELRLLEYALERDLPVLALGRGMQLLNVARGGSLLPEVPEHQAREVDGQWLPARHVIYLSPGAKTAAIIGSAGFFRVNSLHRQGLREAQRSPRLMSTAYSVDDGLIEGLESPEHSWVIGLQCRPERHEEVPRSFANLFAALVERAEMYLSQNTGYRPGAAGP